MNIKTILLTCFSFLAITGCMSTQKSNFRDMSSAYREVIEQYGNDNILLNIVRASNDMPMSFLDIPSVVGSGSLTATAGISSTIVSANPASTSGFFSAGKLATTGSNYGASAGMAVNNTFTFTQASLDNAQFMSTFLKEVPLDTINFRGTQRNLPRAAIFTLLIEGIELRTIDNEEIGNWKNDPLDPDYKSFQRVLTLLLNSGLTVESVTSQTPIGPMLDEKEAIKNFSSWSDGLAKDKHLSLDKTSKNGKVFFQLVRTDIKPVFCLNKYRAAETLGNKIGLTAYCKDSVKPSTPSKGADLSKMFDGMLKQRNPQGKPIQLHITLRSIANVFDFLGNVLNAQLNETNPSLLMIESSDYSSFRHFYSEKTSSLPLFKVYKNTSIDNPICTVEYRGSSYSVSDENTSYTKSVIEFMATLLTISKTAGSIPASPAVLVR